MRVFKKSKSRASDDRTHGDWIKDFSKGIPEDAVKPRKSTKANRQSTASDVVDKNKKYRPSADARKQNEADKPTRMRRSRENAETYRDEDPSEIAVSHAEDCRGDTPQRGQSAQFDRARDLPSFELRDSYGLYESSPIAGPMTLSYPATYLTTHNTEVISDPPTHNASIAQPTSGDQNSRSQIDAYSNNPWAPTDCGFSVPAYSTSMAPYHSPARCLDPQQAIDAAILQFPQYSSITSFGFVAPAMQSSSGQVSQTGVQGKRKRSEDEPTALLLDQPVIGNAQPVTKKTKTRASEPLAADGSFVDQPAINRHTQSGELLNSLGLAAPPQEVRAPAPSRKVKQSRRPQKSRPALPRAPDLGYETGSSTSRAQTPQPLSEATHLPQTIDPRLLLQGVGGQHIDAPQTQPNVESRLRAGLGSQRNQTPLTNVDTASQFLTNVGSHQRVLQHLNDSTY